MRSCDAEVSASVRIAVDIKNRFLFQLIGVSLGPFSRPDQTLFFGIPCTVDNRPLWSPPLLQQLAERPCLFQDCNHSRCRVLSAVDPGIMMVSPEDPFVGILCPANRRDDIVNLPDIPI